MDEKKRHNIKVYYYYATFSMLLILGPIITLYFLAKGLNYTQILTLKSIAAITIVLMEVPTGAIADLLGRKKSLFLGSLCMALGLFMYVLSYQFFFFAIAEVIFAIGMCFKSGADTAIVYDTLKSIDEVEEFTKVQGNGHALSLCSQIIGSILAGFLYSIHIELPMLVSGVFILIAGFITFFFYEIENHTEEKPKYHIQIKESIQYTLSHKKVKKIILFSMIFYVFYRVGFDFFQPYLKAVNIDVIYFGFIFGLFNSIAAISGVLSQRFIKFTKGWTLMALGGLLAISFVLLGITHTFIGFLLILPQQMARGFYNPVVMKYINKHIPSDKRATIISLESLMKNIVLAIFAPLFGYWMDHQDIFSIHLVSGIMLMIILLVFNLYLGRNSGKKVNIKRS